MKREELVTKIAEDAELTKKQANAALSSLLDGISGALKKGDKVTFVGFGTFKVSHRKKRQGINPKTGKPLTIAASNVPSFKAGSKLKEIVK